MLKSPRDVILISVNRQLDKTIFEKLSLSTFSETDYLHQEFCVQMFNMERDEERKKK